MFSKECQGLELLNQLCFFQVGSQRSQFPNASIPLKRDIYSEGGVELSILAIVIFLIHVQNHSYSFDFFQVIAISIY